jgi:hypothetical protein
MGLDWMAGGCETRTEASDRMINGSFGISDKIVLGSSVKYISKKISDSWTGWILCGLQKWDGWILSAANCVCDR